MNELIKTLKRIAYGIEKISLQLQALSEQQDIHTDVLRDVVVMLDKNVRQNESRAIRFNDEQLTKLENIANIFKK